MKPRSAAATALYEQETQPAQRGSVPRAALRFGNLFAVAGLTTKVWREPASTTSLRAQRSNPESLRGHISGLLRRKCSSQ
jgi:hypothetical protein